MPPAPTHSTFAVLICTHSDVTDSCQCDGLVNQISINLYKYKKPCRALCCSAGHLNKPLQAMLCGPFRRPPGRRKSLSVPVTTCYYYKFHRYKFHRYFG